MFSCVSFFQESFLGVSEDFRRLQLGISRVSEHFLGNSGTFQGIPGVSRELQNSFRDVLERF